MISHSASSNSIKLVRDFSVISVFIFMPSLSRQNRFVKVILNYPSAMPGDMCGIIFLHSIPCLCRFSSISGFQ